jgi:hypothetical protein
MDTNGVVGYASFTGNDIRDSKFYKGGSTWMNTT